MENSVLQSVLTYSFILGALVFVARKTINMVTKKKGQHGCDTTCPACEAKNIVKQMSLTKKG